jgi:hypothetical protein
MMNMIASSNVKSFVGGPGCNALSINLLEEKTCSGISLVICKKDPIMS